MSGTPRSIYRADGGVFAYNTPPMPRLTFLGAAGTVTGSKYLVEANGKRLLVDCGLFQGSKALRQRNWERVVDDPSTIDWVALTHAHIDHTGCLPRLVRDGFRGQILANATTRELCALLLPDSAHLMEEDSRHAAAHGYSSHKIPLPLYTQDEAQTALNRFAEIPRRGEYRISPEFLLRIHDAGHILGATSIELLPSPKMAKPSPSFSLAIWDATPSPSSTIPKTRRAPMWSCANPPTATATIPPIPRSDQAPRQGGH